MKISFLVTYYNQQNYVIKSLQSIFRLNIPCEYEILIGDDGSTDHTLNEIKKWKYVFNNNLRIFEMKRNKGENNNPVIRASNLRKYLLTKSTGDFFCILDGDDYYCDCDFIINALEIYDKYPNVSVVMFNYQMVYPNRIESVTPLPNEGIVENQIYIRKYYRPAGSCVFKKINNKNFFVHILEALYYDDSDILIYNLCFGQLYYINKSIYSYCQHKDSIWNSMNRAQQGILNILGADNDAFLAPQYADEIYYRFRVDILYAYFRRFYLDKCIGNMFLKEYLSLCRDNYISKTLLAYDTSTQIEKNNLKILIQKLKTQDSYTYFRIKEKENVNVKKMNIKY